MDAVGDNNHAGEIVRVPAPTFMYHSIALDVNLFYFLSGTGFYLDRVATIYSSPRVQKKRVTELLISNYKFKGEDGRGKAGNYFFTPCFPLISACF